MEKSISIKIDKRQETESKAKKSIFNDHLSVYFSRHIDIITFFGRHFVRFFPYFFR